MSTFTALGLTGGVFSSSPFVIWCNTETWCNSNYWCFVISNFLQDTSVSTSFDKEMVSSANFTKISNKESNFTVLEN